jgi:glycine/D-amino acid oxidase-like deaminating enzyme
LQRFETLIPELEALINQPIPYNRQGILELCFDPKTWAKWHRIADTRQQQGLTLKLLTLDQIEQDYPSVARAQALNLSTPLQGAVHSPQDRQVDPVALTQALIAASQQRGVQFHFQMQTIPIPITPDTPINNGVVKHLQTQDGKLWPIDGLIIAAGTGSSGFAQHLNSPVEIQPVLGQALHLRCEHPWYPLASSLKTEATTTPPVIQGADVHLVPLASASQELWVGATVEFPIDQTHAQPEKARLEQVYQQAIALCPALRTATVLRTWSGWRPRPLGRPAPIIEALPGYSNVWLATGHYRNGVLLAPITALQIKQVLAS